MDNKKKILKFINNWIEIDNYHRRKLVKSKGDNSPHSQPLQLSNHETTSSSSLFHHQWSWTVIKSRPEEHSNTKSGGGADQAWGKEKGGIGIMERRNSRLVDPNYSLRSILTIHRSSCGKSSFLVPDSLHWLPMSEGDDCLRARRGEKWKGCRWRLKPIFPCKIVQLLDASLIANLLVHIF